MKMTPKVKAIILDLGNVLMFHDNALLYRRLGELGGVGAEAVEQLVSPEIWERLHRDPLDGEAIQREVCSALGVTLRPEEFAEVWNCHFTPNDAIAPIVESLIGRTQLVVLSNTNAQHAQYLRRRLPLLDKFDHLLFSHELGWAKPDPRIYLEALRRTGAMPS
ncbi:MAG TPA: HAD family hydrolase, partial [Myxococcaceae bacterium]|nr:HAD family hydrolase [Myxococcaceae bacterium]